MKRSSSINYGVKFWLTVLCLLLFFPLFPLSSSQAQASRRVSQAISASPLYYSAAAKNKALQDALASRLKRNSPQGASSKPTVESRRLKLADGQDAYWNQSTLSDLQAYEVTGRAYGLFGENCNRLICSVTEDFQLPESAYKPYNWQVKQHLSHPLPAASSGDLSIFVMNRPVRELAPITKRAKQIGIDGLENSSRHSWIEGRGWLHHYTGIPDIILSPTVNRKGRIYLQKAEIGFAENGDVVLRDMVTGRILELKKESVLLPAKEYLDVLVAEGTGLSLEIGTLPKFNLSSRKFQNSNGAWVNKEIPTPFKYLTNNSLLKL